MKMIIALSVVGSVFGLSMSLFFRDGNWSWWFIILNQSMLAMILSAQLEKQKTGGD